MKKDRRGHIMEEDKIVVNVNGEEKTFYKLITFTSNLTNKRYLVFTDEAKKIYSSIIENENDTIKLISIENEDDLEEVKKALIQTKTSFEKIDTVSGVY